MSSATRRADAGARSADPVDGECQIRRGLAVRRGDQRAEAIPRSRSRRPGQFDRIEGPRFRARYAWRASPGRRGESSVLSAYAGLGHAGRRLRVPEQIQRSWPSRSALVRRPWASRTENVAAQVAPGASSVHDAVTDVAVATAKVTPTHAPTGRTSTASRGVRGSGSPGRERRSPRSSRKCRMPGCTAESMSRPEAWSRAPRPRGR